LALTEVANSVLAACSEASRQELFAKGTVRHAEADEVLFEERTPTGVVLFPLSGSFQFSKTAERGRRQVLCNLSCNGCRGICLLTMAERSLADIVALTAGDLLVVERWDFQRLARTDPVLCQAGWQAAVECMAHLSNLVEHLSFRKVAERVALTLLESSAQDGDIVRLTQSDLAAEVGTTREVVARCLAGLQAAKAVRLGRARITVVSRGKLEQEIA
ncbi:MAG: family transcriptional regulator, anaerobic regulatory protein, partial [Chloroflexota bacterium]|nr:family transcriptional regulator, anaerobic regulatory protein [Chloroflexota bacterium]